uniref:protein angel homolog 2-like isoform X1 n=1 Tax=Styela clava TaxID=7725 RepID=UPI00193A155D|nr:protein angel homolog 2-like isoform X1 [Styela clava]XP_039260068.1 protein angel homolog 2-like isoform X2 [Styela clava]
MFKFYKFWWGMAHNSNRFIPSPWLRAAEANSDTYNHRSNFSNYYQPPLGWPPQNKCCNSWEGRYQTYRNLPSSSVYSNTRWSSRTTPSYTPFHQSDSKRSSHYTTRHNRKESNNRFFKGDYDGSAPFATHSVSNHGSMGFTWRNSALDGCVSTSSYSNHQKFSRQPARHYTHRRDDSDTSFRIFKRSKKHEHESPRSSAAPTETESSTGYASSNSDIDWSDTTRFQMEREWEDMESPNCLCRDAIRRKNNFRIVSYNILSQKLLDINDGLYRKCDPNILLWEYRWPRIKLEIEKFNADILCLQEVEEYHYNEEILHFLESLDYQCVYKKRTGNNKNKPDGVLIAYKKEKYKMLSEKKVEYFRGNFSPVNQDNVGVITLLKPISANSEAADSHNENNCICIVNTHLLYNPKRGDIKLVQLSTLFAEIHKIISSYPSIKIPIIMCGDFNSTANSHLFELITQQQINYEGLLSKHVSGQKVGHKGREVLLPDPLLPECLNIADDGCTHTLKGDKCPQTHTTSENDDRKSVPFLLRHSLGTLKSAYTHDKPEASTTQDRGITVDYIFYSPCACKEGATNSFTSLQNQSSTSIYPQKRYGLVDPGELRRVRSIPNAAHPSDHLPIVVDFVMVQS